jgi:hypothetical protein
MLGTPMFLVSKFHKRIYTILSSNDDAPASSAITSVGTTTRDVLFATKSHAAVASTTSDDFYFDTINEHFRTLVAGDDQPKKQCEIQFQAWEKRKGSERIHSPLIQIY